MKKTSIFMVTVAGITASMYLALSTASSEEITAEEIHGVENNVAVMEIVEEPVKEVITLRPEREDIYLRDSDIYAGYSAIHSGAAVLYRSQASALKNKTVCVNAGHGTEGGSYVKTFCHPDQSPKTTSGSTGAGAIYATAVSGGTTLLDGTAEADANLELARVLRDLLLNAGYDVLMVRDGRDVQLDNVARTVLANTYADCHISIHYDSTEYDKGAFCIIVPDIYRYKAMEPVASHWEEHNRLGYCIVDGMRGQGVKIFSSGTMGIDLTQTSYSTIPSVDIEVGDRASDHSDYTIRQKAMGIVAGVEAFWAE